MAEAKKEVLYKKKYLETIAKLILNNKEFSDVTLVVNKKKYHASRILMSAASEVFASILKEHFNNTTDKEVLLQDIKHNDGFFNILQYIHGIEINLTTMSKVVFCEMLRLSERYKLAELHQDLKSYFSNVKRFKMNSLVAKLNTAKTYDLTQLYDKLKIYVYQHVEQVIKHKTFVNLQYDVLVDLLKSDWLYAKEIDILRAALNWHDENIMDVPKEKNETLVEDNESQNEADLDDEDIESEDEEAWSEIDMVDEFLSKYSDELFACETPDVKLADDVQAESEIKTDPEKSKEQETFSKDDITNEKTKEMQVVFEIKIDPETCKEKGSVPSDESINGDNKPNEEINKSAANILEVKEVPKNNQKNAVEIFANNILTTLLNHIRFSRMPVFDFLNAIDTNIFIKHKDTILNKRHSSEVNNKPRITYSGATRKFTFENVSHDLKLKKHYYFEETHLIEHFSCKALLVIGENTKNNIKYVGIFVELNSDQVKWECDAVLRITLFNQNPFVDNKSQKFRKNTFSHTYPNAGWVELIELSSLLDPKKGWIVDDSFAIEVHLESIVPNVFVEKKSEQKVDKDLKS